VHCALLGIGSLSAPVGGKAYVTVRDSHLQGVAVGFETSADPIREGKEDRAAEALGRLQKINGSSIRQLTACVREAQPT